MTYTYPIDPAGQAEWKLNQIKEIFNQLKHLGNKFSDLPHSIIMNVNKEMPRYGPKLMHGLIFDAFYDMNATYLNNTIVALQEKIAIRMNEKLSAYVDKVNS